MKTAVTGPAKLRKDLNVKMGSWSAEGLKFRNRNVMIKIRLQMMVAQMRKLTRDMSLKMIENIAKKAENQIKGTSKTANAAYASSTVFTSLGSVGQIAVMNPSIFILS